MHLAIDVREACSSTRTGKGQWTYGFVSELLNREIELTLFSNSPLPVEWRDVIKKKSDQVHVQHISARGFLWHWKVSSATMKSSEIDFYVSTVSFIVPFLLGKKKSVIPVVHDLIAFRSEPHDRKATFIERLTLRRTLRSARKICTVSNTTKNDLLVRYSFLMADAIVPIFAGPVSQSEIRSSHGKNTILSLGTLCPRKNQLRIIQAYKNLPDEIRSKTELILVGKSGWNDADIVALATSTEGVTWKKYVSDDEVDHLMHTATFLAFPSLYEGFGMPILDAFRIGLSVITSDRGSMKEIAEGSAILVDPESISDLKNSFMRLLEDSHLRHDLSEKGKVRSQDFTWKKTVDLFLDGIR